MERTDLSDRKNGFFGWIKPFFLISLDVFWQFIQAAFILLLCLYTLYTLVVVVTQIRECLAELLRGEDGLGFGIAPKRL